MSAPSLSHHPPELAEANAAGASLPTVTRTRRSDVRGRAGRLTTLPFPSLPPRDQWCLGTDPGGVADGYGVGQGARHTRSTRSLEVHWLVCSGLWMSSVP